MHYVAAAGLKFWTKALHDAEREFSTLRPSALS
jgi:hypothetical protein